MIDFPEQPAPTLSPVPWPVMDLGALSAKLRQDDLDFRRSFALGQLGEGGAGVLAPAEPIRGSGAGAADLRARLLTLIEQRTGTEPGYAAGERLDRMLSTVPVVAPWLAILEAEPVEGPAWIALIEALTIKETYFFRDPDQLDFIRREVVTRLVTERKLESRARLTCWCAGCSSGEEVYSLAILIVEALREAGEAVLRRDGSIQIHPRWRISVFGSDMDRAVLREAPSGRYPDFPMGPFRSLPDTVAGYFEYPPPAPGSALNARVVRPEIRALTSFMPFNLVADEPPVRDADLILCRNVLIYLNDQTRSHAQALFHRALVADGTLALGPTDAMRRPDLFQPVWGPSAVLYRKKPGAESGMIGGLRVRP